MKELVMKDEIVLLAWKDHPLGGFRLWKRGDKFRIKTP